MIMYIGNNIRRKSQEKPTKLIVGLWENVKAIQDATLVNHH